MKQLKDTIPTLGSLKKKAPPNSPFNASINEIETICPFTAKYSRGYWSKLLKRSGKNDGEVMVLLKKAKSLEEKYNRCGFISNQLRKNGTTT